MAVVGGDGSSSIGDSRPIVVVVVLVAVVVVVHGYFRLVPGLARVN